MDKTQYITDLLGQSIIINNDSTMLYVVRYDLLSNKFKIDNWEGNRPPDMLRIPDIKNLLLRQDYVDGTIYLSILQDNTLVCYDGMHRLTALKELYKETDRQLYHNITINILPRYDKEFISRKIREINECKPIPIITSMFDPLIIKLYEITSIIQTKYSKMFSSSKSPRLPNEFRDNFIEKMRVVLETLELTDRHNDTIINLLNNYNNYIKNNKSQLSLKPKQLQKCEKNDCFLFSLKGWEYKIIDFYEKGYITI
jgi:hypothetical protein